MNLFMFVGSLMSAESLATGAVAILSPFITQAVKNYLGIDSLKAYALHLVVSAGLAVVALALTGELDRTNIVNNVGIVTMIATTVFKLINTSYQGSTPESK